MAVKTPEENGKKKAYRLGEKVTANIQADYYLADRSQMQSRWWSTKDLSITTGFLIANILVLRRHPTTKSWLLIADKGRLLSETIKTDATGKAALTLIHRRKLQPGFRIHYRGACTGSSRREIKPATPCASRQRYYVYPA